jgi:hypothetical protein
VRDFASHSRALISHVSHDCDRKWPHFLSHSSLRFQPGKYIHVLTHGKMLPKAGTVEESPAKKITYSF